MTTIVIFNAPPSAGKDTAAALMDKYLGSDEVNLCSFKKTLVELAIKLSGLSERQWADIYTRELKDVADYRLQVQGIPVSPRRYLIWISEEVIKPVFGDGFFGREAGNQLDQHKINAFSDGGFAPELDELMWRSAQLEDFFCYPEVAVARIHREGCTFANDSRGYLQEEDIAFPQHVKFVDIYNDGMEEFISDIKKLAQSL